VGVLEVIDTGLLRDLDEAAPLQPSGAAAEAEPGGASPVTVEQLLRPDNPKLYTKGINKRRSQPVRGYMGLNGHGKSFAMVRDALPDLAAGRRILSTVTILDPESGNPHPNFELFTSWQQLHDARNTQILLDEITGVMDARDSGMPKHVRRLMPQLRRAGSPVSWTGIDWDNTDRRMRQLTWIAIRCVGHFPDRKSIRTETGSRDAVQMWAPNRLFVLTTFDAKTLRTSDDSNQFTEEKSKQRRAKVMNREFVRGPGSIAFGCYNTLDAVAAVDNGCPICGGRIPERVCKGHTGAPPTFGADRARR
jgi:hypothetical protein